MTRLFMMVAGAWTAALGARKTVESCVVGRRVGPAAPVAAIPNAIMVRPDLWRGAAPSQSAYAELADAGVSLIVDLRAEADIDRIRLVVDPLGIELLGLATVDMRVPDPSHIDRFAMAHLANHGTTYIHCEAGEGRTGAILGAWHVRLGHPVREVLADSMAIGYLSVAQLAFIATKGQLPALASALDWTIDRPTEWLGRVARRGH